jgi:hypothetical protein
MRPVAAAALIALIAAALAAAQPRQVVYLPLVEATTAGGVSTVESTVEATAEATAVATATITGTAAETSTATETILQASATATPTINPTPPAGSCTTPNDPPLAEGLQAWLYELSPPGGSTVYLCTRLVVQSRHVVGALVQVVIHWAGYDQVLQGQSGRFVTFASNDPVLGPVVIDVTAYYQDQVYAAQTGFTAACL